MDLPRMDVGKRFLEIENNTLYLKLWTGNMNLRFIFLFM